MSALLGGGRRPPSASCAASTSAPSTATAAATDGGEHGAAHEQRDVAARVQPGRAQPEQADGEHAAREVVDAERDRRPAVRGAVGLGARARGEAREAERPARAVRGRGPCQRAAAEARREGRRDERRGDRDRGRAERDGHGHGRHPESIRPGRVATCPPAVVAWCGVAALDYAFFGPNDALYGIAGGPPDARRAVLVVSPPGVDAVRARRVLFRLVRALGGGRPRRAARRSARQRRERARVRGDVARDARRRHPRRPARARAALSRGAPGA